MKERLRLDPKTGEFISVMSPEGYEIPDPTPMAPPVGFKRQVPLHERIRAMVQHEYLRARALEEVETPEEADDFLVPDEAGEDPREARFGLMPGHEHDWEDYYEPPKDFKDMHKRLVEAGWKPPEKSGAPPSTDAPSKAPADPPSGGSRGQVPVDKQPAK